MKIWWATFVKVLVGLFEKPMWLMILVALCVMSTVYAYRTVWDLPVAVIDQDHSSASRMLIRNIDATPKISLKSYDNLAQAKSDLIQRKLFAIMIIPNQLEKHILAGKSVAVPVYGDATNRLANGQIQQDILQAYREMLNHYSMQTLLQNGFDQRQAQIIINPVQAQTRDLFNPGISFAAIIFPGLLVMLLQHSLLIASVRVSMLLRQQGKIPISATLGGLSALIPIWLFLSLVLFVVWPWLLGYRQSASIPVVLLLTFPFLLAVLGLGKLVTECLRSVELIYVTLSFMTMPIFYISGTIWPLQAMPGWVQCVSSMLPSTWATKAIAGVNQMGLPWQHALPDIAIMLLLGVFYTFIGIGIGLLRDGRRLRSLFSHRKSTE